MENNKGYTGEQLTFYQMFKVKNWEIEIPIIQRDYAQGRVSTKEIRDNFLNTLYSHLKSRSNINLDFVYGSISEAKNNLFIPLDGQQRLTTLFLLHWYIAVKENRSESFKEFIAHGSHSKFTYEIRSSSKEFCDSLVTSDIDIKDLLPADDKKQNSLSNTLRDSPWYFASWDLDPTIKSMLTMLDSIHEKFKDTTDLFDKLIAVEEPVITFQFLDLRDFKLTDDLYIKMNARGKQLTTFENFKAKFGEYLKTAGFSKGQLYEYEGTQVPLHQYYSHKIDTTWANLFWNYRDRKSNLYDERIMNFMRVLITNNFSLRDSNYSMEHHKLLYGRDDSGKYETQSGQLSFSKYVELGCLDEFMVTDLISIFDILASGEEKIRIFLQDNIYFDEEKLFKGAINNNLKYTQRIQFFAFYKYLIANKPTEGLLDWIRVLHNLSENTIYNRIDDFVTSMKATLSLLKNSSDILSYLSNLTDKLQGFYDVQGDEEKLKAILILKGKEWRKAILLAEGHGYFKGQIGFLLNFSGIEEYYKKNGNCTWSQDEDKSYFTSFNLYFKKTSAVFGENGLSQNLKNFVWERALLSKGDYLLSSKLNYSFLFDNDRNISWKRLLRDDNSGKRGFVKELLDDHNFSLEDLQDSLEKVICESDIDHWRFYFIKSPDFISYLGSQKNIRKCSNLEVYLLRKERMSGFHAEYFTYWLYTEFIKGLESKYKPFVKIYYAEARGDDYMPSIEFGSWRRNTLIYNLKISYSVNEQNYIFKMYCENGEKIEDDVKSIMREKGFNIVTGDFQIAVFDYSGVAEYLDNFCETLRKLV